MTTQLERMEYELKLAGFKLEPIPEDKDWSEDDYSQSIGNAAWEVCKLFCEQNHSGMSAEYTIHLIEKLLKGELLSPLTNNPDEWTDVSDFQGCSCYQSKRRFSCFSIDGLKTYYDIEEDCNREWELDENGNRTGWSCTKPKDQCVHHELKDFRQDG